MSFLKTWLAFATFGLSGLVFSLLDGPETPPGEQTLKRAVPPRRRGFGEARLGDDQAWMLFEAKDGTFYGVLALHDGLIDAFTHYYLTDQEVTLTGDLVDPLDDGSFEHEAVSIYTRLGQATETAYAPIVAAMPEVWTTAHRGDGIASLALLCNSVDADDFQPTYHGTIPKAAVAGRLRLCFDPRDLTQDPDDQSTWEWSDNAIICWLTYLITDCGQDYVERILPEVASWIAAADVCDEAVTLKAGGDEPRYRVGGTYEVPTDEPADIVAKFKAVCDGWMGETGDGALKVYAGKYQAPTVTIPRANILDHEVHRFRPDEDAVNVITASFTDPAQRFTPADVEEWRDEADIDRRGVERSTSLSLEWVPAFGQARRLMKRAMNKNQATAWGRITVDLYGFMAYGERYLTLELPFDSLAAVVVEVEDLKTDLLGATVTIEWTAVDPATIDDWDAATEEGTAATDPELPDVSTIGAPTGLTLVTNRIAAASYNISATVDVPPPDTGSLRDNLSLLISLREKDEGAGVPGGWQTETYGGLDFTGSTVTVSVGPLPADVYELRAAWRGPGGTLLGYTATQTKALGSLSDLGTGQLIDYFDAEVAAQLTLAGAAVTTWTSNAGAALAQATGGNQPAYSATSFTATSGNRPGVTFDGTTDYLELASVPAAWPSAAVGSEMHALVDQTGASGTRAIFNYGGNTDMRQLAAVLTSGVMRPRISSGTANLIGTAVAFTGKHVFGGAWAAALMSGFIDLKTTSPATAAITLATQTTRSRMGARADSATPTLFFQGVMNFVCITKPLTTAERKALRAFLYARTL